MLVGKIWFRSSDIGYLFTCLSGYLISIALVEMLGHWQPQDIGHCHKTETLRLAKKGKLLNNGTSKYSRESWLSESC